MKLTRQVIGMYFFTLVFVSNAFADLDPMAKLTNLVMDIQKQMVEMRKTIEEQNEKIKQLEIRDPQVQIAAPSTGVTDYTSQMSDDEFNRRLGKALGGANQWLNDLKFSGDLRLRYEALQFTSGNPAETDDRTRFRYRLRYGFEKKFSDEMKVGFALASGESTSGQNVDPTSTNQSFDNLFNLKDIFIEKAFATYSPSWAKFGPIDKAEITGGKFVNPFEQGSSDMVWDRDVRPEGAYEKASLNLLDIKDLDLKGYAIAGQFILDEDSVGGGHADSELYAYQLGLNVVADTPFFEEPMNFLSALSYYSYSDYATNGNFLIGTTSLARGNSNFIGAATELDAEDFEVLEFYNELSIRPFGIGFRPFLDIAHNAAAKSEQDDETWAWALGTKIGGLKKKSDWELSYAYRRIENDSVVGAFNDSDFGLGFAGKRGSVVKFGYALTDNIFLNGGAYFVNNLATDTGGVRDEEQRRFQADLSWKF